MRAPCRVRWPVQLPEISGRARRRAAALAFDSGKDTENSGATAGADGVEYATLEWVDWFNHRRLLAPIGNVPPAEYERMYYDEYDGSCKAA